MTRHRQLVEVYGAPVVCAFDAVVWTKETNADKQRTRRQSMSTTDDNVCGADARNGEDRLSQVTSTESRLFHWVVPLRCRRPAGLQKSLYKLGFKELPRQSRSSFYGILS